MRARRRSGARSKSSEKTGKSVPQKTIASSAMKTQLLSRKLASRETMDSSRFGAADPSRRTTTAPTKNATPVTST